MGRSYFRAGGQRARVVRGVSRPLAAAGGDPVRPLAKERVWTATERRIAWMKKRHSLVKARLAAPGVAWKE